MNQIKQLLAQLSIEELGQVREYIAEIKAKKERTKRLNQMLTGESYLYAKFSEIPTEEATANFLFI